MKFFATLLVTFLVTVSVGSLAPAQPATTTSPSTQPALWLLHLPGMGGAMRIDQNVTRGLIVGGLPVGELKIYDWTGVDRGLISLAKVQRHVEQSKIVADMILDQVHAHPGEHIVITAHSAGTGIAVWALEQLPDDVQIDDLVLIASALSPNYDLSKALKHVRHAAYAFNSLLDTIVLGSGTRVFGTVDRVQTDAAGRVGFTVPPTADATEYAKLTQISYDADWMRFDNYGEHIGAMTRSFAAHVIAPVLQGKGLPPRATTQPTTDVDRP
jgi:pimeloyl-ACP methyl ester carboxylesterase